MTKRIEENFAKTSIISSLLKREALSSWKYCRRGEQWQDDIIDRIAKRKISWELPPKLSFCALKFSLRWWKINISEDFPQKVLSADSDTFLSDPSPIIIAMSLSQSLREGFPKKSCCSFGFCPNNPPSFPQFGQLVQLFLNAKNANLSYIQNDTLSKINLK